MVWNTQYKNHKIVRIDADISKLSKTHCQYPTRCVMLIIMWRDVEPAHVTVVTHSTRHISTWAPSPDLVPAWKSCKGCLVRPSVGFHHEELRLVIARRMQSHCSLVGFLGVRWFAEGVVGDCCTAWRLDWPGNQQNCHLGNCSEQKCCWLVVHCYQ